MLPPSSFQFMPSYENGVRKYANIPVPQDTETDYFIPSEIGKMIFKPVVKTTFLGQEKITIEKSICYDEKKNQFVFSLQAIRPSGESVRSEAVLEEDRFVPSFVSAVYDDQRTIDSCDLFNGLFESAYGKLKSAMRANANANENCFRDSIFQGERESCRGFLLSFGKKTAVFSDIHFFNQGFSISSVVSQVPVEKIKQPLLVALLPGNLKIFSELQSIMPGEKSSDYNLAGALLPKHDLGGAVSFPEMPSPDAQNYRDEMLKLLDHLSLADTNRLRRFSAIQL